MSNEQLGNLDLVDRERKKARLEARKFLTAKWGDQTPTWDSLGADEQEVIVDDYIKFLCDSKNATIANKLVRNKEVIHSMLRQLIKGLRREGSAAVPVARLTRLDSQKTPGAGERHATRSESEP